ncbi:MAG TPA: ferric siderophore ABC transporter substrate-binding protein [Polyangia bacterium]|nr:ferric siderophore ABC transporter substrate-binding protein [Polyangia bacterium]
MRHARARYLAFATGERPHRLAASLFGPAGGSSRSRLLAGASVAAAAYTALGAWIATRPGRPAHASPHPPEVAVELLVTRPLPIPPPSPASPRAVRRVSVAHASPPPARAAQPAQAAPVVARAAAPEAPLDLTDFSIATGGATRSAGGATSSSGPAGAADSAPGAGEPMPDLSRPVSIRDTEWRDCAWPAQADALGVDEQVVAMRAIASAEGQFESGEVVGDPGYGFGAALLSCARRHGFAPALDRQGRPVRARSGLIRFTFTR